MGKVVRKRSRESINRAIFLDNRKMFGLVIPGLPSVTEFPQIAANQWAIDLPNPASINNLTFFITGPLPQDCAAALSCSFPPDYTSLEFIGAVATEFPSDIFNTGWALNPDKASCSAVRLVISLESISTIAPLVEQRKTRDIRQIYAKKVALNLFRFMESFNQNTGQYGEYMMVPMDILDKWFLKFEHKFKFDPNFVLNTE